MTAAFGVLCQYGGCAVLEVLGPVSPLGGWVGSGVPITRPGGADPGAGLLGANALRVRRRTGKGVTGNGVPRAGVRMLLEGPSRPGQARGTGRGQGLRCRGRGGFRRVSAGLGKGWLLGRKQGVAQDPGMGTCVSCPTVPMALGALSSVVPLGKGTGMKDAREHGGSSSPHHEPAPAALTIAPGDEQQLLLSPSITPKPSSLKARPFQQLWGSEDVRQHQDGLRCAATLRGA